MINFRFRFALCPAPCCRRYRLGPAVLFSQSLEIHYYSTVVAFLLLKGLLSPTITIPHIDQCVEHFRTTNDNSIQRDHRQFSRFFATLFHFCHTFQMVRLCPIHTFPCLALLLTATIIFGAHVEIHVRHALQPSPIAASTR